MMRSGRRSALLIGTMLLLAYAGTGMAEDGAKKLCLSDAKRLCPAQVKAMDRRAVEACMIARISETSPQCREKMLTIKEQRTKGRKAI